MLLVETVDRLLTSFPPKLSAKAARSLEHLGVTPLLGHTVVDIDDARRDDRGSRAAPASASPRAP